MDAGDHDHGTNVDPNAHGSLHSKTGMAGSTSRAPTASKRPKTSHSQHAIPASTRTVAEEVWREAAWHILGRPEAAAATGLSHVPCSPSDVPVNPLSQILGSMRIISPPEMRS